MLVYYPGPREETEKEEIKKRKRVKVVSTKWKCAQVSVFSLARNGPKKGPELAFREIN